jgi:predicted aspartyl protease
MGIVFHYQILPDTYTNKIKKPVVRLSLKGNTPTTVNVVALLDSGADVSVIPRGLADFLNLKLHDKNEAKGIGGTISIWNSEVNIKVTNGHENYNFKIPIQVSEDDSVPIIMGRSGFFDKFKIIIDESSERVELKRLTQRTAKN